MRAARYVRDTGRLDWCNGHRQRDLVTQWGLVRALRVPRSRKGTYQPQVFARYQRRQPLVDVVLVDNFIAGIATRTVGEALEALLEDCPSATTASRLTQELHQRVRQFHHRPLEDRWPFLLLDGVRMSVKGATGARKRLVLVAYGRDAQGNRQLLGFRVAPGESEAEWTALLESLRQQDLTGERLRLVVSDGAPGLAAVVRPVYPYAQYQLCWVHKMRNVMARVRKADRPAIKQAAQAIYLAPTRREAILAFRHFKQCWQGVYPKAVAGLEWDLDSLLACFDYPAHLRSQIRTTNPVERAFREVRRRTRPMSVFTNDASYERIIFALVARLNTKWSRTPSRRSHKSTHYSSHYHPRLPATWDIPHARPDQRVCRPRVPTPMCSALGPMWYYLGRRNSNILYTKKAANRPRP